MKLRWSWRKVKAGQVISFMYGKGSKRKRRTVLVMMGPDDPRASYKREYDHRTTKLLHCLILKMNGKEVISGNRLKDTFKLLGGIEVLTESKGEKYYRVKLHDNPRESYKVSRKLINKSDIYRTFNVRTAKTSAVYLEDYDFPQELIPPEEESDLLLDQQQQAEETWDEGDDFV